MARQTTTRWGICAIAGVALSALTVGIGAPAVARSSAPAQVELRTGDGTLPEGLLGARPTLSGDGRFVAFESSVPDGSDDGRRLTVFLVDRIDASATELAPVPDGLRPGDTVAPVLSGDGCTLVAVTELAHDRFRDDDTGTRWDVYRTRLPHCGGTVGDWELVSSRADESGVARDDVIPDRPAVDRAGTVIGYTHPATRLDGVEGADAHELTAVSVVDLTVPVGAEGHTAFAPGLPVVAPNTSFAHGGLDQPALSADGRYLAFRSDATSDQAVAEWHSGPAPGAAATGQVYVWDRTEPDPFRAVALVSATPDGQPAGAGAASPTLSRDGRVVAFTSRDQGLAAADFSPCADRCPTQVYRVDRDADGDGEIDEDGDRRTSIVSARTVDGRLEAGTSSSSAPAIDASGQIVAFVSRAANLDPLVQPSVTEDGYGDIFVADVATGDLRRVRDDEVSTRPVRGRHGAPQLSDTARALVFDTAAPSELGPDGAPTDAGARHVVAQTAAPRLALPDADLGTTLVGLQSDEWYLAVVNDGPSAFRPASVSIGDAHFTINPDGSTCLLDIVVPPGGDCVIKLAFTPTQRTAYTTTLTVAEEGYGAVSVSAVVSGAGGEPALRATPAGADLGTVDVGSTSDPFVFDIANVSPFATAVGSVGISGAHRDDFTIVSNSCADRPLNPNATCAIGVTFTPGAAERRTALLEITTPHGQYTSALLSAVGRFEPSLAVFTDDVIAGREVVAIGTGYRPNIDVTLALGDGDEVTVTTNYEGGFMVWVPVDPNASAGPASLTADSPDGPSVSPPVEVVPQSTPMIRMPGFGLG